MMENERGRGKTERQEKTAELELCEETQTGEERATAQEADRQAGRQQCGG